MEFGPEIKVDGKRPKWLKDDEEFGWKRVTGTWTAFSDWTATERLLNWSEVQSIRLPANHPRYTTPTPDERAVALVRKMVEDNTFPSLSCVDHYNEARAILAALEPVDPALLEARQVVAGLYEGQGVTHLREQALSGDGDEWFHTKVARAALARGRQLEKEGK